ncbi:DUF1559 domain-containing protein [Stieleria sp. ICT_E10.1]|uniref:DUF1559 domain-containing protein n=1 Tax=Stieleria sedimenti TaxID=2976331 RepID=UPI00217F4935|nr:DUF1559 domain-containing protein [Stieleria sedimenti]MCS7466633.1 DUF1559 domain-containing protein [Stieleria sedimenti]
MIPSRQPKSARRIVALLIVFSAGLISVADGQELRQGPPNGVLINDLAASHPVSAYIDASTLLVAEIDWENLDVDALFASVQKLTGDRPSDAAMVKDLIGKLKAGKAGRIYVLAGLQTLTDRAPLIVIPTPDAATLFASLKDLFGDNVRIAPSGSALLFGTPDQLKRVESLNPVSRSDILSPLHDANRLDHSVVIALPDASRDLLTKLWPAKEPVRFPVKVSPSQAAADIHRLVITVQTPPQPMVRLSLDTVDAEAADRVAETLTAIKQQFDPMLADVTLNREPKRVIVEIDGKTIELAETIASAMRQSAARSERIATMKQLGIAFYNYHDREKHLPPRCFVAADGKPLHSWLVAILPDMDNLAFYRSIRLDLTWDADENERLRTTVPAGFGSQHLPVGHTIIRAPVFPGSLWHGDGPPKRLKDITDPAADTILLIEAPDDASIHWADPTPWVISEDDPMENVFGNRDDARVLLADGSVLLLKRAEMDNQKLKAMLTIAAGD